MNISKLEFRNIQNLIPWVLGFVKQSYGITIVCSQMKIRMGYFQIQNHKRLQSFGTQ